MFNSVTAARANHFNRCWVDVGRNDAVEWKRLLVRLEASSLVNNPHHLAVPLAKLFQQIKFRYSNVHIGRVVIFHNYVVLMY